MLIPRLDAKALPTFTREAIMKRQVNREEDSLPIDSSDAIPYGANPAATEFLRIEGDVSYLWVALGGAAGAAARFAVAQWAGARWGWTFPWGTFAVNLTGSLAIGLVMTLLLARGADPAYRLLLVTGFLGGYTTFSAFSFEVLNLLEARRWDAAALYVAASVVLGLLATALGLGLGRLFIR